MKKLMIIVLFITFFITGCSHIDYERDTSEGEMISISLNDMETKMTNQESFVISFTQESCMDCYQFKLIFDEYKKDHHLVIYDVSLSKEDGKMKDKVDFILKYFPEFEVTPGIYYVENGKIVSTLDNDEKISEEIIEKWVIENQLDKK